MFSENLGEINLYLKQLIDNEEIVNTQNLKNKIYNNEFFYEEMLINDLLSQFRILYDHLHEVCFGRANSSRGIDRVIHLTRYIINSVELDLETYGEDENFKTINKIHNIIVLVKELLIDSQKYNKEYLIENWNNHYLTKFKNLGVEKVYEL